MAYLSKISAVEFGGVDASASAKESIYIFPKGIETEKAQKSFRRKIRSEIEGIAESFATIPTKDGRTKFLAKFEESAKEFFVNPAVISSPARLEKNHTLQAFAKAWTEFLTAKKSTK